jgi:hypothetical protein
LIFKGWGIRKKRRGGDGKDSSSIFRLTTAFITLNIRLKVEFKDLSAICIKEASGGFSDALDSVKGFLSISKEISYSIKYDRYGYIWIIIEGIVEDAVAAIDAIADTFIEYGFEEQILAAIFAFNYKSKKLYLIYNYKSKRFYPFAPIGSRERDYDTEMLVYSIAKGELNMENDVSKWYPIWDIPL